MIDANRSLIRYRLTQPNTSFIVAETTETEAGPAGTFCAASPPVRPARKPTSRVINATTDPMSTNLPRANRRSRQATNTMVPSRLRLARQKNAPEVESVSLDDAITLVESITAAMWRLRAARHYLANRSWRSMLLAHVEGDWDGNAGWVTPDED